MCSLCLCVTLTAAQTAVLVLLEKQLWCLRSGLQPPSDSLTTLPLSMSRDWHGQAASTLS